MVVSTNSINVRIDCKLNRKNKIEMYHQTICRIVKLFYQLRIWRDGEESTSQKTKYYYLVFYFLFQVLIATCAILSEDQDERTFLMVALVLSVVIIIKLMQALLKKEEILGLLNDPIVDQDIKDRDELKLSLKMTNFMRFVHAYLFMAAVASVFLYVSCLPIFSSEKRLPMFISFTLTWKYSSIIYWIAYAFLVLGMVVSMLSVLITVLIWYLMLNYSIEYEVLGNKLRNLGVRKVTKVVLKKDLQRGKQNLFQQDLIGLIKDHRQLFETTERFRSCLSTLFLAQITTGAASICICTFNLAYSQPNFSQTVVYSCTLLYGIFDIFLVMYLANEITLKSNKLSYCLFESDWIEQSESCKKCLIIMCEVLKQPQKLVVLIYPIDLETFLSIINGAYSMFNILKRFK